MAEFDLSQHEGKELELFRNYGNPYETISIRVQIDDGCMYLGDEEFEHGPDGGHSMRLYTFDAENTRKVFQYLSQDDRDPIEMLKGFVNDNVRTHAFTALCDKLGIAYVEHFYL